MANGGGRDAPRREKPGGAGPRRGPSKQENRGLRPSQSVSTLLLRSGLLMRMSVHWLQLQLRSSSVLHDKQEGSVSLGCH
jgi:hypothetical protein